MLQEFRDWVLIRENSNFKKFSEYSEIEKRVYYCYQHNPLPHKIYLKIYQKDENIVIARKITQYYFMRNKFFQKNTFTTLVTITPKRIFSNDINIINYYLSIYYKTNTDKILNKTNLRKLIFGKIKYLDLEDKLCNELIQFKYHIDNYENIKEFLLKEKSYELLFLAKVLNKIVKTSWSERKILDLEKKWKEEVYAYLINTKSDKLIWENYTKFSNTVTLLNSERDYFREKLYMHNCIFNYFTKALHKHYITFHVKGTKDFLVGFGINERKQVVFDQAYYAYNQQLNESDFNIIKSIEKIAIQIVKSN